MLTERHSGVKGRSNEGQANGQSILKPGTGAVKWGINESSRGLVSTRAEVFEGKPTLKQIAEIVTPI